MSDTIPDRPICMTMLICERITFDERSGDYSLHGIMRGLAAPSLPVKQSLGVFIELTGMHELSPLDLRIHGPHGLIAQLHQEPPAGAQTGPNVVQQIAVQFSASFGDEGRYLIELANAGGTIAQRTFNLRLLDNQLAEEPIARS